MTGTSGKVALTTSHASEISSLSLNEMDSNGVQQIIPLTKCSNAFTTSYRFRPGSFNYHLLGTDTNGIKFDYNLNKTATFRRNGSGLYQFQALNRSEITIEYTEQFSCQYRIQSELNIGATNFTFTLLGGEGFASSVDPTSVFLLPQQSHTITLTSRVNSGRIAGGSTHGITLRAENGCEVLSTTIMVTVNPVVCLNNGLI